MNPRTTRTESSRWLRQNIDVAGLKFRDAAEDFRRKREDMNHAVGLGTHHDDGEGKLRRFILLWQSFVHGKKQVKLAGVGNEAQKFAVADARPTGLRDSFDGVAGKLPRQILWQTFVEQDAHSSGGGKQAFAGLFKKGNGQFARDRGVLFQKFVERFAAFNVIQQCPHGDARADKARLTAHYFGIGHHNELLNHARN